MLDDHPYFALYLVGCALVPFLMLARWIVAWTIRWVTKTNIVVANLKKMKPQQPRKLSGRLGKAIAALIVETALSWINVVVLLWSTATLVLRTLRDAFSSAPEGVKKLRFPLRNNPDLPVEAVWAYTYALNVQTGAVLPDEHSLADNLSELSSALSHFEPDAALEHLEGLRVVKRDVLTAARRAVEVK